MRKGAGVERRGGAGVERRARGPRNGLRRLAIGWMVRHHAPRPREWTITRQRLYILPTRGGLAFGAVLALMLVTSINYGLALGHALTFLAGSVAVITMLHTHRNLAGLALRAERVEPVFAGDRLEIEVVLRNPTGLERHGIALSAPGMARAVRADVPAGGETTVPIRLEAPARGWMPAPRFRLLTAYPLGLWRTWSWWQPATRVLVYPRPETPPAPLPATASPVGADMVAAGRGDEDIAALRAWRAGDSPRRIAWRAVARSTDGELLTKEFEGGAHGELLLDWHALPAHLAPEARLSRLARWVLDADAAGACWELRLPLQCLGPDHGPGHRQRCLEALALAKV